MANIKVELLIILELKEGYRNYQEVMFFNNFIEFVQNKIISLHTQHKKLDVFSSGLVVYLSCDNFCSPNDKITITCLVRNELMNYFNQYSEGIKKISFELTEIISGTGLDLN